MSASIPASHTPSPVHPKPIVQQGAGLLADLDTDTPEQPELVVITSGNQGVTQVRR